MLLYCKIETSCSDFRHFALFSDKKLSWQSVYYHYRKWSVNKYLRHCWIKVLKKYKSQLDLSSVDFDGSHTPAIRGGEQVSYQGRKKRKTTNAHYLTDRQGIPLAISEPVSGNHNDLYNIEVQFEEITSTLEEAEISVKGLFINADAGFDSKEFRDCCEKKEINANICFNKRNGESSDRDEYFDKELYNERYTIERTNAWLDSFRSLLNRFDITKTSWLGFNYLAFIVIALKKFNKKSLNEFYRKWCKTGVFKEMFETYLEIQKDKLDTEKLNLDGTHSLVKKSAQSVAYQHRKRGRTSNILIMTDGRGIPIANGGIISGNHNDLYQIVPQYAQMIKDLKKSGICVQNSIQNADKGFDSNKLRRAIHRRKMFANIIENKRNRKGKKRGKKRFFNQDIYDQRFVNERTFAWIDSFRTLLIRFDTLDNSWLNWHYLAFALILLKV